MAVKAIGVPVQTGLVEGETETLTGSASITETMTCAVLLQPFASFPVTVYVFVAAGTNGTPSITPLFQT